MNLQKKHLLVFFAIVFLSTTVNANECINFSELKTKWTSFKTLEKIAVSGTFNDVEFITTKNKSTTRDALLNTQAKLDFKNIDAKAKEKTNNILKYFVSNLEDTSITAKIIRVNVKTLDIKFTLNKISKIIPMKYKVSENKVIVKGVIDTQDFNLAPALKILNKEVKAHQNKSWFDIPIKFELFYTKICN